MKEIADTILAFIMEQPQTALTFAIAVLLCIALYQLIRLNGRIRKIAQKIKKYMDTVMDDTGQPVEMENTAVDDSPAAIGSGTNPVVLTEEERRCLLEGMPKEQEVKKRSRNDEAIFNEVLREYF